MRLENHRCSRTVGVKVVVVGGGHAGGCGGSWGVGKKGRSGGAEGSMGHCKGWGCVCK